MVGLPWGLEKKFRPHAEGDKDRLHSIVDLLKWLDLIQDELTVTGSTNAQLQLELLFSDDYQFLYTEYTWDPATGDLLAKDCWDAPAKNIHVFTTTYVWLNGELQEKTVTCHINGLTRVKTYAWDLATGDLLSTTVSET